MYKMTFKPLFNQLNKRNISKNELVVAGIVTNSTLERLRRDENVNIFTIIRIMQYLEIDDFNDIMILVEVKDEGPVVVRSALIKQDKIGKLYGIDTSKADELKKQYLNTRKPKKKKNKIGDKEAIR